MPNPVFTNKKERTEIMIYDGVQYMNLTNITKLTKMKRLSLTSRKSTCKTQKLQQNLIVSDSIRLRISHPRCFALILL